MTVEIFPHESGMELILGQDLGVILLLWCTEPKRPWHTEGPEVMRVLLESEDLGECGLGERTLSTTGCHTTE